MLKGIISAVIIVFSTSVFAQQAKIKGTTKTESDGTIMPYVSISLDNKQNVFSDAKGEFEFSNLNTGAHKLSFSFLGFTIKEIDANIAGENEVVELPQIKLTSSVIQINEVVVSTSPNNYSSRYDGSNFIISSKDIIQSKPIGTEEVLKKVAGINVSGDMGISNRLNVGIRGSYPRRAVNILLLEDGTPIAPAPYLAPEAYYNPPSERLDGVEILKGADILTYGSNTMYGVINYITKKPPLKPTLGVNVIGGENGYNSQYLTYGGTWNNIGAEIQVLNKHFDGFQENSQSSIFNTTAKIYSELNSRSSVYLKLNYHQEKSKASYSALTPFTFKTDPKQNPFDADDLYTKRYAVDLIYNYKISANTVLSTKAYASQFQRDWWRQENTLIKASTAKTYLGDAIYNNRYSYLEGKTFGADDYIRVGKVVAGKESTRARNRLFRVGGAQMAVKYTLNKGDLKMNLDVAVKAHFETFNNIEIKNDSSRFSRSGTMDKENYYELAAYSAYLKDKFTYKKFSVTPSIRYEWVQMFSIDKYAVSKLANNDGSRYFGSDKNIYSSIIPGGTIAFDLLNSATNNLTLYTGLYKGYNAPTAEVGFLNVEDGIVSAPTTDKPINRDPEVSLNYEAGFRGTLLKEFAGLQVAYFNNNITNYYSAGRNEAFQTLGAVNISGVEASVNLNIHKLLKTEVHQLTLSFSGSMMHGKVLSGKLKDSDLLKAKHTDATKQELIDKINKERGGYDVYYNGAGGKDSLVYGNLAFTDFSKIKRLDFAFGKDGIADNSIPYLPPYLLNAGLSYSFKGFSVDFNINYVAKQYTDYLNFNNETSEGAIGSLKAFSTIDANIAYSFSNFKNKYINGLSLFVAGKNLSNEIYQASRLHRVSSGIMPCGFRLIIGGIKYNF